MRSFPRTSLYLCVATVAALSASESRGDQWRVHRGDQGRSGVASGPVALEAPNVAWRTFLGGSPSSHSVMFPRSEGAAGALTNHHAVVLRGGRFVALNVTTQQVLWRSEQFGPGRVAGIADLDGDGIAEVVVQTESQAHVLDSSTGATLWSSSLELVETMGATRVRDIDGDGLADVYIDNGVGAKYGIDAVSVYSFATGQAIKLWDFPLIGPEPPTVSAGSDALLDLNGDGEAEVVLPSFTDARILRGSDGTELTTLPASTLPGLPFTNASAMSADLDGVGDLEVLIVQENAAVASQFGPSVTAYGVDVASGASQLLWTVDTGSYESELASTTDLASDLDGDGTSEIVFSYRSPATGGDWVTKVLAGDDGSELQQLPGRFEGAADLDGDPGSEIVIANDAGIVVMKLDESSGALAQMGSTIPQRRGVSSSESIGGATTWVDQHLAVVPRPGKSSLLLAGELPGDFSLSRATSFKSLDGYAFVSGDWQLVATHTPLVGTVSGVIAADFSTRPYEQLAVGDTAGTVTVLNQFMQGTNGLTWIDGSRLGAFVAGSSVRGTPLVGSDSAGPFVVLPGTALGTVVADASFASWIIPPIPRWAKRRLTNASILDVDGSTQVVGVQDGNSVIALDSILGTASAPIGMPTGMPWGSPVALQTGTDTLVGIDWRNAGGEIFQTALSMQTGATEFVGEPILTGGFFGSSVGDLDGDGVDEWYSMTFASLWRRNGATGQAVALGNFPNLNYALPTVTQDVTGNNKLLLQGGFDGPALLAPDGTLSWQAALSEATNGMAGVVLQCGSGQRYVTPGVLSSTLSFYDAADGSLLGVRSYAGGLAFADPAAAIAAGQSPGVFSNVNGVESLNGAPAAVAGSSDGNVYVIDPCTTDVVWAADLGASAGEPIIADADGDGEDEILVATGDGFLVGLDSFSFPTPFISLAGQTEQGANVGVGEPVTVSWSGVDGAAGYEVALVGPDERAVWSPAFRPASGTSFDVDLTGALPGRPYRVAVRVAGDAPGQEGFSAPVMVDDVTAPELTATPASGVTSVISFTAMDDLGLDFAMARITGEDGAALALDEKLLQGASQSGSLEWAAPEAMFGTDVMVEVVAVDTAGLISTASFDASVDDDGMISYSSIDEQPIDEQPIDEESNPFNSNHGCACETTSQQSSAPVGLMLGLMIGIGVARRGRRNRA
jgi:MYXO-CTERM domain-containing protein